MNLIKVHFYIYVEITQQNPFVQLICSNKWKRSAHKVSARVKITLDKSPDSPASTVHVFCNKAAGVWCCADICHP
jgi:hypothetical protein